MNFPNAEKFLILCELEMSYQKILNSFQEEVKRCKNSIYFHMTEFFNEYDEKQFKSERDNYIHQSGMAHGIIVALNLLTEMIERNDKGIERRR